MSSLKLSTQCIAGIKKQHFPTWFCLTYHPKRIITCRVRYLRPASVLLGVECFQTWLPLQVWNSMVEIRTKASLRDLIIEITKIQIGILARDANFLSYSVAQKMPCKSAPEPLGHLSPRCLKMPSLPSQTAKSAWFAPSTLKIRLQGDEQGECWLYGILRSFAQCTTRIEDLAYRWGL
jgi:hypothetical protein